MSRTRIHERTPVNRQVSRRRIIRDLGAIAAGTTMLPAKRLLAAPARETRIGVFGPSHCTVPFVYAELKGFFHGEGLHVSLKNYPIMSQIAADLIRGKLDFGQLIVPLALAMHAGTGPFSEATPVVIPQITGTNGAALLIRSGAAINSPSEFKGKTVGNHSALTVHYLLNMMFLEDHGLDYHKDVQVKIVELGKVVDEVKSGRLDAAVMPEPKNAAMEKMGVARVYMLSRYLWPNHPCCALVTRQPTMERDTELVTAVTRAITRAALEADNPDTREETVDLLRSSNAYNYDRLGKDVLLRAFIPGRADFCPFPYQSTFTLIAEEMKKHRLLPPDTDAGQLAADVALSEFSRSRIREVGGDPPPQNHRAEKVLGKIREYAVPS